jgi:hypothetical protein
MFAGKRREDTLAVASVEMAAHKKAARLPRRRLTD